MRRITLLVLTIAFLQGCSEATQPSVSSDDALDPTAPEHGNSALLGYEVYEAYCASCHDTGLGNAPLTGEPTDWNDRSQLWMAVLAEHVKAGYLNMPARGGDPELTDLSVSKAVEHMMLQTYPEKTRD